MNTLALQLLLHLTGDYCLQSNWMASQKTSRLEVAILHALTYSLPFVVAASLGLLEMSLYAWLTIFTTHALIDHYRVARYVGWAKNLLSPPSAWRSWSECSKTGYPPETPDWLAVWLLIIVDNTLHLAINALALALL